MIRILIVDDDRPLCRTLEIHLANHGHEIRTAGNIARGRREAEAWNPDLVLLDMHLPDGNGLEVLPDFIGRFAESCTVLMTADTNNIAVAEAMHAGAYDYLRKPVGLEKILSLCQRIERLKQHRKEEGPPDDTPPAIPKTRQLVGMHPKIVALYKQIGLLSRNRVTVLIEGESGTGKELAARILHDATDPQQPFVPINCCAFVATLLESELFGHEKGAFTGATERKTGKLQYVGQGTLFLDEIGDMPIELQGKLLRVIQEGEFVPVGGLKPIPMKARIVSATHRNLQALVSEGKFREDLYYRLVVSKITLPSLRERPEDIPLLVECLLEQVCAKLGREPVKVDSRALHLLGLQAWPGNIRELENVLTRAVSLTTATTLDLEDFVSLLPAVQEATLRPGQSRTLAEAEKHCVLEALNRNDWKMSITARELDISPTTLRKKIGDYHLKPARRNQD